MNEKAFSNFKNIQFFHLFIPLSLLIVIAVSLFSNKVWTAENYINIQKEAFLSLNLKLSTHPQLMYNLTQLGDAIVILSFVSIFVIYAPRIWESIISASLISALMCSPFKWLFKVQRPAAGLENDSFFIVGKAYFGSNSLPSGHAITACTVLTVIMIATMPKNIVLKIVWGIAFMVLAIIISLTRVAVGAHYILDVVVGGIIGCIAGLLGIISSQYCKIWTWIKIKRHYFLLLTLFVAWFMTVVFKMLHEHLIIYYIALSILLMTILLMTRIYVKK